MSIYDQELPQDYEEAAAVAELPVYINDGVDEQPALSPEDQARVEELNRVGSRNTVIMLGGIMLEGAGLYLMFKGHKEAAEIIGSGGIATTGVAIVNSFAVGRGIQRIRQSYHSRHKR